MAEQTTDAGLSAVFDMLSGLAERMGAASLAAQLASQPSARDPELAFAMRDALQDALTASVVLGRGVDVRRRALSVEDSALEREIDFLRRGSGGPHEALDERRRDISAEAERIKQKIHADLEQFCTDIAERLPAAIENASSADVRQHLAAFLEHVFKQWAEEETREVSDALEALAQRTVALVQRDAENVSRGLAPVGPNVRASAIEIDTFAADLGVVAVLTLGLGVIFANVLVGGLLLVAAPALARYSRDRAEFALKQRAVEVAPKALRDAAQKVEPYLFSAVDEFVARLDAWAMAAGRDIHRELIEVLSAAQKSRQSGAAESSERALCDELEVGLRELVSELERLKQISEGTDQNT